MLEQIKSFIKGDFSINEVGIFEFGIHGLLIDALLINCHKQMVRGFEFKVSRADFLQDKKWPSYLKYCNLFYFVCPEGIIKKDELPAGIGLIYVGKDKTYGYSNRKIIKRARKTPIATDLYVKIVSLMLQKAKHRQDGIF